MTTATLAVIAVTIVACGGDSSGGDTTTPPASQSATITIEGFSFGDPVTIAAGDTVTIENKDSVAHSWTSDDDVFNSGSIDPDGEFEFTFEAAGEYPFHCRIHPSMKGSLTVTG